jgi:O-antigen/teichoic acid export membrane protein
MKIKEQIIEKIKNNKEFSKNLVWRILQTGGTQGVSFAIFLVATYFLTKEEMGIYNYVFASLNLLVIFADFGISTATSKYVAEYNTVDKPRLKKVLFNMFLLVFGIAGIVSILVVLFGGKWFGEYYKYVLYTLPIVFFSPISSLYDGIYRGLKKFKRLAVSSLCVGAVTLVAVALLVSNLGLTGALLSQDLMYFLLFIILAFGYREFKMEIDKKVITDISKYSLAFGIATLGYYLFSRVNVVILGKYDFLEEIATYELLNKIFNVYLLPFTILGQVLAPYTTEIFALKEYKRVRRQYFKVSNLLILVSVLFIPVTMILTRYLIKWFLPQYDNDLLTALLLPVVLTYAKNVYSAPINAGYIVATGDAAIMTVQNIISGGLNVVLSIIAVDRYGYLGVIWTTLIVQAVSLIVLQLIYIKRLKKYAQT